MSATGIAAWALALLFFPLLLLAWATESRPQRARRLRRQGWTWQQVAAHLGTSPTTARRWAAA
jgi:hypothetical protein